jgi:2-dehydro-3-deoxyphosphogluconate aldolase / (4S)-4-hydroxy-2-oxoglutarate aldolase
MASFDRLKIFQTILDTSLVPLFFHADYQVAYDMVAACAEGGATLVEFTNRGEGALPIFARLVEAFKKEHPKLILGVGSILDAPTAVMYMMHGANYIVAPNFNLEVAKVCNRRKVPYIPGCATPTEIGIAEEAGAEIVKVFPPSPELIKAVLGPMPWSRLMPAGGVEVSKESVEKWLKAGAVALGVGSSLVTKNALANRDKAVVSQGVANMLGWIKEVRSAK